MSYPEHSLWGILSLCGEVASVFCSPSQLGNIYKFYFKQFILAYVCSLNVKIVPSQIIQFSISTLFSSIWPIDRTLSGATTPSQRGTGSDDNKGDPQYSRITGKSPSDCLVSNSGHSLGWGLTLLDRSSRCILQPQLTGQYIQVLFQTIHFSICMQFKCQNSPISNNSV